MSDPSNQMNRNRIRIYRMIRDLVYTLRKQGPVILLDSQHPTHPASRKIVLAGMPLRVLSLPGDIHTHGSSDNSKHATMSAPWEQLRIFRSTANGPVMGYFGYDLKNHTERLSSCNPDPVNAPDMWFIEPGLVMEIDRDSGNVHYLRGNSRMMKVGKAPVSARPSIRNITSGMTYNDYSRLVSEARRRITEGDFYEINLTRQMQADFTGDSYDLFEAMRVTGPVPFASYIAGVENNGSVDICCASPERFLYKSGSRVISEPIKGTIAAGRSKMEDLAAITRLKLSMKDQAENLMIVDLVRNDLGRVALKGTVKVESLFDIQSFKTVHQMVSRISAEVAPDSDPVGIINSCFPMGSMTGAPKISAMIAIDELENYRRGIYSGAIGYITKRGDFDFNVVIRTAIIRDERLYYSTGGAITGDSEPELEWQESLVKSRALLHALGEDDPPDSSLLA
jgi:para-aminobenzoate synthetase component I